MRIRLFAKPCFDEAHTMKPIKSRQSGPTFVAFERSYRLALTKHMQATSAQSTGARIGRRARDLGIETLTLAQMHDRATADMKPPTRPTAKRRSAAAARSRMFFRDVITPIQSERGGADEARAEAKTLTTQLARRTRELADLRTRFDRDADKLKAVRADLRTSGSELRDLKKHSRGVELRLRRMTHRIITVQEKERLAISRDLHDAIGQALSAINVGLAALENDATVHSRALSDAVAVTQRLVARSLKAVHQFAWELRPALLDDLGLVMALRSYAKDFTERVGVKVSVKSDADIGALGDDERTTLFRVAQGALSNVHRHAQAKSVRLTLRSLPSALRLEIKDDGRGFDAKKLETAAPKRHLGLLVMRERLEMVGGSFTLRSSPGRGTTVRAEVPIQSSSRD